MVVRVELDDLPSKVREGVVMELLRKHRLSQGQAARVLGICRSDLFPLMKQYQISVVDLTTEELHEELHKPLPD
jgi:DNA-binding NtrC family response regulator